MPVITRSMTTKPVAVARMRTLAAEKAALAAAEKAALVALAAAEENRHREDERVFRETIDILMGESAQARTNKERMGVITRFYKLINSDLTTIYHRNPDSWIKFVIAVHIKVADLVYDLEQHHTEATDPMTAEYTRELVTAHNNLARLIGHHLV